MFNAIVAGTMVASLLAAPVPASAAPAAVPGNRVAIDVMTVNGSGCPAGTATVTMAPDNTAFQVRYDAFLAQVGGAAQPTDVRKNCQIALLVDVPQGFTYAIARAEYRGTARLARGATGLEQAAYYFQGESETAYVPHAFSGPMSGGWRTTDTVDAASLVFAPCGAARVLNINAELRVSPGTSDPDTTPSFLAMDASAGSVQTVYQLSWRQCDQSTS